MRRKTALICTTYNCQDELDASLKIFTSPANLGLLDEIVIVDGGSKDGTWELLNKWASRISKLDVYQVPGANISRGRNEAIKRTDAEIIVTFDSGTRYEDDWLKLMLEPFENQGAEVVGALTVAYGETFFESCFAALKDKNRLAATPSHRGCAFYKKVWETIGGYPEHVEAGEDTWFNTQWRKLGFKYVHVPEAKAYWRVRRNWKSLFNMARRNTKGHIALGETFGTTTIFLITVVYILGIACLIWGFSNHLMWYIAAGLFALNALKRMLGKGRWRTFVNPVRFLIGAYGLTAFDLGVMLGAVEGSVLFLKHKMAGKKARI